MKESDRFTGSDITHTRVKQDESKTLTNLALF